MTKTIKALLFALIFLIPACSEPRESPVVTTTSSTTTTSVVTATTTAPPTTTTTLIPTTTSTSTAAPIHAAAATVSNVWDVIAHCESGGNWAKQGRYEGGLQFSPYTWTAYVASGKPYGLIGYPSRAYEATREQQITVAIRVRDGVKGSSDPYLNPQGWNAWPTCRHDAGV